MTNYKEATDLNDVDLPSLFSEERGGAKRMCSRGVIVYGSSCCGRIFRERPNNSCNRGKRVGVVTNDRGKYLVDTAFVSIHDVPTVEVTGGCFCCNYDDLEIRLETLRTMVAPDVIFAESVGSCADVVANVMKPLTEFRRIPCEHSSLSVVVDNRLLLRRLKKTESPPFIPACPNRFIGCASASASFH